ncbi:class I SAM-dependent methyltransferase [Sphingomonas profundi]|uniref:class I SAM-dependent methyltransferase n=1 Tax=Alterirhizorhabdus profundi TaxID=2681549 RepID=UPI001E4B59FC|nr:methyltransferase domain-containing protein [Sphingomonas profundi]
MQIAVPIDAELSLATSDTFDEIAYIAANPDLLDYVRRGGDARQHFERFGRLEGRRQVAGLGARLRREKLARFCDVLDAEAGDGGTFRFLAEEDAFPVGYGDESHRISDYAAESANPAYPAFVREMEDNPDRRYIDIGCGRRNYSQPNCLYLEVYPSLSADIIMQPACTYPIRSGSLDGIGCFAVLEHVTEPWRVAEEFRRMLKPGGKLFVDWPFLQPVHGYPSHYYNATREGLRRMF